MPVPCARQTIQCQLASRSGLAERPPWCVGPDTPRLPTHAAPEIRLRSASDLCSGSLRRGDLNVPPQPSTPGEIPVFEDFSLCIHCGLCLNHCPTYRLWHLEADSPRGRIRQMILVNEGQLPLGSGFVDHIDKCLDCRSCETACPSGVEYGKLVQHARARIENEYRRPWLSRVARNFVFESLLPFPSRIANDG